MGSGAVVAGLLQATSLPFIAATQIGVAIHAVDAATAAALVGAGLLSALLFPTAALGLIRDVQPTPMMPMTDDDVAVEGSLSLEVHSSAGRGEAAVDRR